MYLFINSFISFCSTSSSLRCKIRVLDSFGSDAEFNFAFYKENIPGGRSVWGSLNLLLPQFMTMYRELWFSIILRGYRLFCLVCFFLYLLCNSMVDYFGSIYSISKSLLSQAYLNYLSNSMFLWVICTFMLPHQIDLVCLYASLFCYVLFYFILCFAVCMFYTVLFLFYFLLFYVCLLFSLAFLSLFSAHSPDNSFVGFAVPDKKHLVETKVTRIGTKALVYGKMPFFWEVRKLTSSSAMRLRSYIKRLMMRFGHKIPYAFR